MDPPPPTIPSEADKEANQVRFETELEFVQCLANPFYLQSLAQQGLLADEAFLNYLTYLKYWHQPSFARFIQYPQCLHLLDLLTHPSGTLREQLIQNQNLGQDLAGKQLAHWAGWRESAQRGEAGVEGEGENGTVNGGANGVANGNGHA